MKIIKKPDTYEAEIVCKRYKDERGSWGQESDYCGAVLSVDENDICYRMWIDLLFSSEEQIDYGIVCPCCGSFIQIPEYSIPKLVRKKAISYEQMKLREGIENQ